VGIGEGPGFGVKIEEVVHQEDAEAKAMFDDWSVNASSQEGIPGFDCGLEKEGPFVGRGGRVRVLHQHKHQVVLKWWQCLPPKVAPASRLPNSFSNTTFVSLPSNSALWNCCIVEFLISLHSWVSLDQREKEKCGRVSSH